MADSHAAGPHGSAEAGQPAPNQPTPSRLATHDTQAARAQSTPYSMDPNAYGQPFQSYYQQPGYQQQQQTQYGGATPYYAPYASYGQQPQPAGQLNTSEIVPHVQETKAWIWSKMILHGLAVLFSIICLALGIALSTTTHAPYMIAIAAPVPIMSIVWSAAELIVRKVHLWRRGIHPGGQVAACLILWLACIIMGPLQIGAAAISAVDCSNSSTGSCSDGGFARGGGLWMAIGAFTGLLWMIYFVLFIMACIDTSRRNRSKRTVMVVNSGQYWGQPATGWQPMPQWQQGQQYQQGIPLQNQAPTTRNEKSGAAGGYGHGIYEFYGGGGSGNDGGGGGGGGGGGASGCNDGGGGGGGGGGVSG